MLVNTLLLPVLAGLALAATSCPPDTTITVTRRGPAAAAAPTGPTKPTKSAKYSKSRTRDVTPPSGLPPASAPGTLKTCAIQFDGRVKLDAALSSFDTDASPFGTGFVKGAGISFSQLIQFPAVPPSLFDIPTSKAFEVTINDKSIFAPNPASPQVGFRRAELMPSSNSGSDNSTVGVKFLHFSVMKDAQKPLNTSHEYQLVFVESADFSTNQFVLKTGTIMGEEATTKNPDTLKLVGNVNSKPIPNLFEVPFTPGWHNYGLLLNFNANTVQVFYSAGKTPLKPVTQAIANDISGRGQYHFGVLKKPTGSGLTDVTKQGFQSAGISEGVIYGGIFQEDVKDGCVSLLV